VRGSQARAQDDVDAGRQRQVGRVNAVLASRNETGHAQIQRGVAEAIFSGEAPIPETIRMASGPAHASRFGVYRNNVIASLIDAVAARYPAVRNLLWDDGFDRVARLYIGAEPPRSPLLLEYGESFPQFLRNVGQSVAADYVADVAEIERARTRAYHSADAVPLASDAFAKLSADDLLGLRLRLHPSLVLLKSRFPAVCIWQANRGGIDQAVTVWKPEFALIARPELDVEVRLLSAGAYGFLSALADGQTVDAAMAHGIAQAPDFDLAECFNVLIAARIAVELIPTAGTQM
jgi:hypothetical protein